MVMGLAAVVVSTMAMFNGWFRSYVPVTLTSDRSGLVMEPGGKVKMRGLAVGRVAEVRSSAGNAALTLEIDPQYVEFIPANTQAQINATTAFGAKYVDLIYPSDPSAERLHAGQVLQSANVTTEVNTVFQNVVNLLQRIDPAKLNAVLTAIAEGVRGQGQSIGQAISDANVVLLELNPRSDVVRADFRSLKGFSDGYGAAAGDLLTVLDSLSTTSITVSERANDVDALLVNLVGLADSGIQLLGASKDNLVRTVNALEPTTGLLAKYSGSLTCTLLGAQWFIDNGGAQAVGGNGYSIVLDATLAWGQDPYRFPDNLPIVGAKGGPGGKPGCGSLPDPSKRFPVRQLVTNTGWGTGNDIRVNPGIGFPGWANYFPVTRAVPEPPSVRNLGGPAPGPIPYPGAPPYGGQQYAPDGTSLYQGLPPAPPPGAPREGGATPGSEPFEAPFPMGQPPTPLPPPPPPGPPPPQPGPGQP
jgi:phospholipid/cholesterol/gamma-HCH transport system substrate-binding protein